MDRAEEFRSAATAANRGRQRQGWRFTPELKALAIEHCRERREVGRSYAEISEDLGIAPPTLSRWLEEATPRREPSGSFRPVELVKFDEAVAPAPRPKPAPPQVSSSPLSVVTPGGFRIEGLSWQQVLELAEMAW